MQDVFSQKPKMLNINVNPNFSLCLERVETASQITNYAKRKVYKIKEDTTQLVLQKCCQCVCEYAN